MKSGVIILTGSPYWHIALPPLSYVLLILAVISFVTQIITLSAMDLGLGVGGNQRLYFIFWTTWIFVISTHLMSKSSS